MPANTIIIVYNTSMSPGTIGIANSMLTESLVGSVQCLNKLAKLPRIKQARHTVTMS